jgi:hypothetical protein
VTEPRDLALPTGYTVLLGELKERVRTARTTALRTVNTQLIELYWSIGRTILERQEAESWGSGVVGRLADGLRAEFPEMKGLSRRNLFYMRVLHARLRCRLAGPDCATARCTIALGPHHHPPGQARLSAEP